nr:hypothetical protein [Ectobacillus panaciterrae]
MNRCYTEPKPVRASSLSSLYGTGKGFDRFYAPPDALSSLQKDDFFIQLDIDYR